MAENELKRITMNGRMIFGIVWMASAAFASYLPGIPKGAYSIMIGNFFLGLMLTLWGMAAKGYFRKTDNPQE
jgi:hypothetical protein